MLLKLKAKMIKMLIEKMVVVMCISFYVFTNNIEASEQDFQFHGFVAQGLIDVDGSDFVNDDASLSPELTEVGINASYRLSSNLRLAGQVVYLNGGNRYVEGLRVDYALLDWSMYESVNWQANLYLGRFKNNHWLYSSSRDIPFARPSIILPQSIYFDGFRDIAVGADGAAIKISHSNDDYGNFDLNISYGSNQIDDKQAEMILSEFAKGTVEQDFEAQISLYWQPNFSSWRFGISYLDSDFSYKANDNGDLFFDGGFSFQTYSVNALYEGENWEFSGELHQTKSPTIGFYQPSYYKAPVGRRAYVQSRYKVSNDYTLLARHERFYNDEDDKDGKKLDEHSGVLIPAYFGYHIATTIGASYDFSSDLRLSLEYHWFRGTGRLTPVVLPNPQVNDSENWKLWAVQLMYWF
jgi:hypothetical protein